MGTGLGARACHNPGQCRDRHCAISRSARKLVCCTTSRGTTRHRRRLAGTRRDSYIESTVSRRARRMELPLEPAACGFQADRRTTTRAVFVRSTVGKNKEALTLLSTLRYKYSHVLRVCAAAGQGGIASAWSSHVKRRRHRSKSDARAFFGLMVPPFKTRCAQNHPPSKLTFIRFDLVNTMRGHGHIVIEKLGTR